MTETILAFDPGWTTGWALFALDDDRPVQRLEYGAIHDGLPGFVEFIEQRLGLLRPDILICEKFNEDDGRKANADLTPLPIEGALYAVARALNIEVTWQSIGMKVLCSDQTLKDQGLWITPAEAKVDPAILWTDARDVNDAQIHIGGWCKAHGHEPTVEAWWPEMVA